MTGDLAASVRGRLQNQAKQTGRPLQELMQYFAMERFLYRLSHSVHADRFVLKGALMLRVWGTEQSRATRDIDLMAHADNSVEAMTTMIRSICSTNVEPDGVIFDGDTARGLAIKEDADYSGVRLTFTAMIQNARLPMQIDIGFGDVIHPGPIDIDYPGLLDFEPPRLSGYPVETAIAEKFEAMVKLGRLNSRMKDFYDVLVLSRQFSFDGEVLATAIGATFSNRGTKVRTDVAMFNGEFGRDAGKQTQWTAFVRRSRLSDAPEWLEAVVQRVSRFLLPVARSIEMELPFSDRWEPGSGWGSRPSQS